MVLEHSFIVCGMLLRGCWIMLIYSVSQEMSFLTVRYLCNSMTYLHKTWHDDAEQISIGGPSSWIFVEMGHTVAEMAKFFAFL